MSHWLELEGKTAVVTGGGSGIGRGTAIALAEAGCQLFVLDLSADAAEETASAIRTSGSIAIAHQGDTTDLAQVAAAAQRFRTEFGAADVLVNNAGVIGQGELLDASLDAWRRTLDINLTGYLICAREFGRGMIERRSGSIVHVTSICGIDPSKGSGAYSSSKAAATMLMRQLALELAPHGIRSNAVAPGLVRTPLSEPAYSDSDRLAARERVVPLGRIGSARDIADTILWLASDRSSYITGQQILVDGGFDMTVLGQLQSVTSLS
jgi:NAD(P)-dependent dehydrogenase (short-subunit alcohol dehydrogenase family)